MKTSRDMGAHVQALIVTWNPRDKVATLSVNALRFKLTRFQLQGLLSLIEQVLRAA